MKRKIIVLMASLLLAACGAKEDDLLGHWVNTDPDCTVLCGFTVEKKETAFSDFFVSFDEGPFYKGTNGPLIKKEKSLFVVQGALGDLILREKDGFLYGKNGEKYVRSRDISGTWSSASGSCKALCEFEVTLNGDRLYHVRFTDSSLYGYYDGLLYKDEDGNLLIKGNNETIKLIPQNDGELKTLSGTVYRKNQ